MQSQTRMWSPGEPSISVEDVADWFGTSVRTVQRWCAEGDIPAHKAGRDWVIEWPSLQAAIDHWLYRGQLTHQAGGYPPTVCSCRLCEHPPAGLEAAHAELAAAARDPETRDLPFSLSR